MAKNKTKQERKKNGNIHPTRIFKSPEELEKAFAEYKENVKEQSKEWVKVQYVGKDGIRVEEPQKVPYTLEGFERFCRENYGEVGQYFDNQGDYYKDFIAICRTIRREIRENQITGGLLGFYNPSITQRLNNLTDRQDLTSAGKEIQNRTTVISLPDGSKIEDFDID